MLAKEKKKSEIMQKISMMQETADQKQSELLRFLQNEISSPAPRESIIEAVMAAVRNQEELNGLISDYLNGSI